jgi:hypothetical protein
MKRLVYLALLCAFPIAAQTTNIAIPAASGGGIKTTLNERMGVNLDDASDYGPGQTLTNLIASPPASFPLQIWNQASFCASSGATTTAWQDNNPSSPQRANFWAGATFQVVSGADINATGTITSSTAANGSTTGQVFTLSPALGSPCSSNDTMILRCRSASTTGCASGLTPDSAGGYSGITGTGSWSAALESTDLSPSSSAPQALELVAPGSATALNDFAFDQSLSSVYGGGVWLNLNGNYALTFRAKATSGTPTFSYEVFRNGGTSTVFLNGSVTPTVNTTPGAGWTNYSFPFTASETGAQNTEADIRITATGGTVLTQDWAVTESTSGGNPTIFRNTVYQYLLAHKPGTLRFMTGSGWGCTLDAMITSYSGRPRCGYSSYANVGYIVTYGLNDFLLLAASVGADPWWTFSAYSPTTDMANMAAYFNAPCSSGNSYATIRCNFLATAAGGIYAGMTWPQVFTAAGHGQIYLEMGNEIWNSPNGENLYVNNGQNYGLLLGANVAAFKASPYYISSMHIVGSGFVGANTGNWNNNVLTAAQTITNGLPDFIDAAPYQYTFMTDVSTNQNVFGPMFAEPVNFSTLTTGPVYQDQHFAYTNFGVNSAHYEENMNTTYGLTGVTQAELSDNIAGVGAGLAMTENMLLAARDAGIKVQNAFTLPSVGIYPYVYSCLYACSNSQDSSVYSPVWGVSKYMSGPGSSGIIDRPTGIALGLVNNAIGNKLYVLNTVQTGTPTYNMPGGQPNPGGSQTFTGTTTMGSNVITSVVPPGPPACGGYCLGEINNSITGPGIPSGTLNTAYNSGANTLTLSQNATSSGSNTFYETIYSIAPNTSVPEVQAFGFGDGAGNYSVIAYNFDLTNSHAITFSGSGAPTGTCTKTVFTSTNITDNNEGVYLDGTPVVSSPSSTSYNCGSGGDTLAPYSMVTYTYTVGTGAQTWYIRQDGAGRYDAARVAAGFTGSAIGCDGLGDVAYPGSGTNQHCAFGDFRFLYDDQTYGNRAWVAAGGDKVVVRGCAAITGNSTTAAKPAGPCRIGFDFQGPCSGAGCGAGYTWCYGGGGASGCGIPAPPAGTSGQPTVIEGGCYPSCSTGTPNTTTLRPNQSVLAELFGDFSVNTVFDLSATQYVLLDGLYLNTHATCIIHISPSVAPCSSSAPFSSYANEGVRRDPTTSNITLTDLLISGMEDSCLYGPMDGVETLNDVECAYNGYTGDNYDDGTHSQSGGTVTRTNFTSIWNGCEQYYGSSYAIPISYCADDSSSGNGDGTATPGVSSDTFVNRYETMAYNTQDGDDVGHNQAPGSAAWYNSTSYGNEGGSFKSGGESAILVNSLSVTNCRRMLAAITGAPSTFNTYLSDACRAGGDGVGFNFLGGGSGETIQIYNDSIVSYGGTMIDVQIQGGGSCTGCVMSFQNNAIMGYTNPNYNSGAQPTMWNTVFPTTPTYNDYYNLSSCPASGTGEVCTSPLWVGQPATPTTDSGLDNFDFYPTNPGSPLIHGGGGGGLTPVADYFGVATTSPPVIGAVNAMAAAGYSTITSGHVNKSGHTITQ